MRDRKLGAADKEATEASAFKWKRFYQIRWSQLKPRSPGFREQSDWAAARRIKQENRMARMETSSPMSRPSKPPPLLDSDFCQLAETLSPDDLALLKRVRAFVEGTSPPVIDKYWADDALGRDKNGRDWRSTTASRYC